MKLTKSQLQLLVNQLVLEADAGKDAQKQNTEPGDLGYTDTSAFDGDFAQIRDKRQKDKERKREETARAAREMMAKKEEDRKKIFQEIEPLLVDGAKIEVIDIRKSKSNDRPLMKSQVKGGKVLTSILRGDQIPMYNIYEGSKDFGFSGVLDKLATTIGGPLVVAAILSAPADQITRDLISRIVSNLSEITKSEAELPDDTDNIDVPREPGKVLPTDPEEVNKLRGVDLSASKQMAKIGADKTIEIIRFIFPYDFFSDAKFKPSEGTDVVMRFSKNPDVDFNEIRQNFLKIGTYNAEDVPDEKTFLASKNVILGRTLSNKINVSVITREPVELVAKHLAALVLSERYAVEIDGKRIDL